ncbi:MAG: potassium-transporting ATPase subunit KdpC [Chloroflexota bacterium]
MTTQTTTTTRLGIEWSQVIRPAIGVLVLLTILTGVLYPAVVTGISQALFPSQANGSLIKDKDGNVIGSALIGQQFSDPKYFWGRLSATGPVPYNGGFSSGSNYGPLNPALIGDSGSVESRVKALHDAEKEAGVDDTQAVPVDLVTASGSGLDPEISPAAAAYQVARVAVIRKLDPTVVQRLVDQYTDGRLLGLIGEPRVNVLKLNIALDATVG